MRFASHGGSDAVFDCLVGLLEDGIKLLAMRVKRLLLGLILPPGHGVLSFSMRGDAANFLEEDGTTFFCIEERKRRPFLRGGPFLVRPGPSGPRLLKREHLKD
jgi:hypothetical protein